jgi:hypothetical protein
MRPCHTERTALTGCAYDVINVSEQIVLNRINGLITAVKPELFELTWRSCRTRSLLLMCDIISLHTFWVSSISDAIFIETAIALLDSIAPRMLSLIFTRRIVSRSCCKICCFNSLSDMYLPCVQRCPSTAQQENALTVFLRSK